MIGVKQEEPDGRNVATTSQDKEPSKDAEEADQTDQAIAELADDDTADADIDTTTNEAPDAAAHQAPPALNPAGPTTPSNKHGTPGHQSTHTSHSTPGHPTPIQPYYAYYPTMAIPTYVAAPRPPPPGDPFMTGTNFNPYQYNDASTMGDPIADTRRNRGGVIEPFPEKLHRMLQASVQEGHTDVVSFFSHGRAFAIHKPRRFAEDIMPRFFKQTRLTSFQRQLNLYGFRRISQGPDNGGYYHELFLQGRAGLSVNMKRVKVKGGQKLKKRDPDSEPNFYTYPPIKLQGNVTIPTGISAPLASPVPGRASPGQSHVTSPPAAMIYPGYPYPPAMPFAPFPFPSAASPYTAAQHPSPYTVAQQPAMATAPPAYGYPPPPYYAYPGWYAAAPPPPGGQIPATTPVKAPAVATSKDSSGNSRTPNAPRELNAANPSHDESNVSPATGMTKTAV